MSKILYISSSIVFRFVLTETCFLFFAEGSRESHFNYESPRYTRAIFKYSLILFKRPNFIVESFVSVIKPSQFPFESSIFLHR